MNADKMRTAVKAKVQLRSQPSFALLAEGLR